jgi:hypothetical protein
MVTSLNLYLPLMLLAFAVPAIVQLSSAEYALLYGSVEPNVASVR